MDIDLFSDMVKGLILDNDEVTLPGLGTFVSEVMPSTFSDKGYTINSPYRKLSFRQRGSGNEEMMAEFYAEINGTDLETSKRILFLLHALCQSCAPEQLCAGFSYVQEIYVRECGS